MKLTTVLAAALTSCMAINAAHADVHKLRLGHFWPPGSSVDNVISDWADKVKTESQGELEIEIYPSQTLAKAPQSYTATVNGIMDITVTAQGYMAGRFPITQVIELPGIVKTAENASCVLQTLYENKLIDNEYQDTHPLFFFAHGPGHLHTNAKQILTPEDVNGLRIRRATTVVAEILTSLGAQPIGMPAPETYTAAQRKVIDGVAFPWQAMKDFRLNEQLSSHTELALYTLAFIATMNNNAYARLPDKLKAVIDQNSGMTWARTMGRKLDDLDAAGRAEAVAAGHTINTINKLMENPQWKTVLEKVVNDYLEANNNAPINAKTVYQKALEYKQACS